jgi:hypothetical protein
MKKIIFFLFLLSINNLLAQTNMNIYYTNGSTLSIPITTIDSITYTLNSNVCPSTVIDVEGNIYNTVIIGTQCWMKENLKTMHYSNGAVIPNNLSATQWNYLPGACADYNNDSISSLVYGKLYNWYAVANSQGLCPIGWHVPDDSEWNILVKTIDANSDTSCINCVQSTIAGGALKEIGLSHWTWPNTGASNTSTFTGLPGGCRYDFGGYSDIGDYGFWWTSSQSSIMNAYKRYLHYSDTNFSHSASIKYFGFSVRCIKD